jgi:hypothetical protein
MHVKSALWLKSRATNIQSDTFSGDPSAYGLRMTAPRALDLIEPYLTERESH